MASLVTVPTFQFEQGDVLEGGECPIQILYYHDSISLDQNGNSVIIDPMFLNRLFKEIKKHLPEAERILNK